MRRDESENPSRRPPSTCLTSSSMHREMLVVGGDTLALSTAVTPAQIGSSAPTIFSTHQSKLTLELKPAMSSWSSHCAPFCTNVGRRLNSMSTPGLGNALD